MAQAVRGGELVGRVAECREIDGLIAAARAGRGGALLLRGEAGIGKTALLEYAIGRADGMTVLRARGLEAESEIPFSSLGDVLRPLMGRLPVLPDRQAAALAGALALAPPTGADPFAVAAATLGLLASAASDGPILVAVDDLQWVDSASSDAILFAARRLEAERAAILFTLRDGEAHDGALSGLDARVVTGLDRASSLELIAAASGQPVPEDVAERLFVATGGNPLALVEIPRMLPQGLVAGLETLGDEPLPIGEHMGRAFARRASGLPAGAQGALLVAAANDASDIEPVLGALMGLGLAVADLEAAEASGLLSSDGLRLEFRHPLVRSAIYQAADPAHRRDVHRALAGAMDGSGVETAARRAWHLAAATLGRDEHVAAALEDAAAAARHRSGYGAAGLAFERAARLSPDPDTRARRLLAAAESWQLANHYEHALALLAEADGLASDRLLRADIADSRTRIDTWRGPALSACDRLVALAEEVREVDASRAAWMLADATSAGITGGDLHRALVAAERAHELAAPIGGDVALLAGLQLGKVRILTGDVEGGYPLLLDAVAALQLQDPLAHDAALVLCVPVLMTVEAYDVAELVLETAIAAERVASAVGLLAYSLGARSELEVRTGQWAAAAADGTEAVQLAREAGQAGQLSYNLARLARLEAAQGRDEACRTSVARAIELADRHSFGSTLPFATSALGLLEVGRARWPEAIRHLEETRRLWDGVGFHEPGRLEWQADLVEARLHDGGTDAAARDLEDLERQARACRRPAPGDGPQTGCTLALAAAARCRGLLADPGDAERWFVAALAWHAWTQTPFERARTELCFGEQLRRAGRRVDARVHLAAALETFDRLGADPWGDRARGELAATGERVEARRSRPMEQLTAQELQVAILVAGGATNREAGAALFLTTKTIEFHLAKIYRKLDLRSRTELAGWVSRQHLADAR